MKYRKRPIVIEAFKLGDNWPDWFTDRVTDNTVITHLARGIPTSGYAEIKTLEGKLETIRDSFSEIYGVKL